MRYSIPVLAFLVVSCSEPAAPIPALAATSLGDTLIVPVVHVSDAVPRGDGSWALLGIEEMSVYVADFAGDSVHPHPGITRAEVPGALTLMGTGDTIFVGDYGLQRVTAWLPDGRRVDAVPMPAAARGAHPRARDAAGQWYFELWPSPGADGRGVLDSGAVVRANALLTSFDTVVRLTPPDVIEVEQDGRIRLQRLQLAGTDRWGVLRDGTVWLARVNQNQLFWYPASGGAPASSRPLPDPIIQVTEMDRQVYIRRYPEEQRSALANTRFAGVKPPFERAFADQRGRVWLFKSAVALDTVRSFQVADTSGVLFTISIPSYGTALGISDTEILMGEEFPEGIRLLRFAMPAEAKP